VRTEHGYTALSRAREETHVWVNDAPGPLGECSYIHGDPLVGDRVASLARQLSQSVIEPLALEQGLPVASASDRQLVAWRDELEGMIRRSPIASNPTDQLVALDAAIAEARETAECVNTSGARAQVDELEREQNRLVELVTLRDDWLEANTPGLHRYSVVAEEIHHRINARLAAYEMSVPDDVLQALGPRPGASEDLGRWREALHAYAEARLVVGATADLSDPAVFAGARWRDAADVHQGTVIGETERSPALRPAM
jgi:hypothetical protein